MEKIQESILYPMIIIPVLLMFIKRFTYFFNLEWDKIQITSFEKFKHRVVDSLLIMMMSSIIFTANIFLNENNSIYRDYKDQIDNLSSPALLVFNLFLIFISLYMLLDIFQKNILSRTKIQIIDTEKKYTVLKGIDGSFHSIDPINNNQYKKYGKSLLDESVIEYSISTELSKVNTWIESKVNQQSINKKYKFLGKNKMIFHFILTVLFISLYIIFYGLKNDPKEIYYFYWAFLSFSFFTILELTSAAYVPLCSRFINDTYKKIIFGLILTDKKDRTFK